MKFLKLDNGVVTAIFLCKQDEAFWPGLVEVADDDERYVDYVARLGGLGGFADAESAEALARAWRDDEIARVAWLRDRHRDELELGGATSITTEQYTGLLEYIQQLRDWPANPEFPAVESRPQVPDWVVSQTQ